MTLTLFFIITAFVSVLCQDDFHGAGCPPNSVEVDCVNPCNTCDSRQCSITDCIPGCECIAGFAKDFSGRCIPRSQCHVSGASEEVDDTQDSGGCPNRNICRQSCKRRGFKTGFCLGRGRRICRCAQHGRSADDQETEPIQPRQSLLGSLQGDTCPSEMLCKSTCIRRGFREGICLGPERRFCNCYSRLDNLRDSGKPGFGSSSGGLPLGLL